MCEWKETSCCCCCCCCCGVVLSSFFFFFFFFFWRRVKLERRKSLYRSVWVKNTEKERDVRVFSNFLLRVASLLSSPLATRDKNLSVYKAVATAVAAVAAPPTTTTLFSTNTTQYYVSGTSDDDITSSYFSNHFFCQASSSLARSLFEEEKGFLS